MTKFFNKNKKIIFQASSLAGILGGIFFGIVYFASASPCGNPGFGSDHDSDPVTCDERTVWSGICVNGWESGVETYQTSLFNDCRNKVVRRRCCSCDPGEQASRCPDSLTNACGASCPGTKNCCVPDNSCTACAGSFCPDGCGGTVPGSRPWTTGNTAACTADSCCNCDCSATENANRCSGVQYTNACGKICTGTKGPNWDTPTCKYNDLGNVCSPENCEKSPVSEEAYCVREDRNGCLPAEVINLNQCPASCTDTTVTCPSCSWKEVKP